MTVRREFLQLAKVFRPEKDKIAGWYLSEKLDGTRCLWDGGISRGRPTTSIPWASVTNPKTNEPKPKIKPIATGLWSRYGNPIMAPDEFLDQLPPFPCDGELWAGRGNFQLCRSICGGDSPDPRFDQIQFAVFSSPPWAHLFQTGLIKNTNMLVNVNLQHIETWLKKNVPKLSAPGKGATFEQELFALRTWGGWNDQVYIHRQTILPLDEDEAAAELNRQLDNLLQEGAEGIIIRDPNASWVPKRTASCLKFKPWDDDEGTIVGFTSGRETAKGSKLLGMIGSLILDYNGKRLELAGLTNEERTFATDAMRDYASTHPGVDMPGDFQGVHFKVGDTVTFKYRELSDDGVPKEARYWRQRGVE